MSFYRPIGLVLVPGCLLLRSLLLNEYWFRNLHQAQKIIADWRTDYNEQRLHSSLDYLTPAEFAVNQRQHTIDFLEHQVNE